jgi:hypothetical protein
MACHFVGLESVNREKRKVFRKSKNDKKSLAFSLFLHRAMEVSHDDPVTPVGHLHVQLAMRNPSFWHCGGLMQFS